ncbi:CLUMA_CG015490, isoform A [Clunio marinus]|uniref:CLUMA_CG015490, isoform A n=1 Tax=Clunio marinus TaxID=568069 RepID=A0A1J1IPL4_9DIPT|nr:CLUMA_CG015490, isoform A [Clunio marinus]
MQLSGIKEAQLRWFRSSFGLTMVMIMTICDPDLLQPQAHISFNVYHREKIDVLSDDEALGCQGYKIFIQERRRCKEIHSRIEQTSPLQFWSVSKEKW